MWHCGHVISPSLSFTCGTSLALAKVIEVSSSASWMVLAFGETQIGRIAKGFAPMLTEILEDYIGQNTGVSTRRIERIKAARCMLGAG